MRTIAGQTTCTIQAMGINGLIQLCTLDCSACDFSAITPRRCCANPDEVPTAVVDGNCWIYECAYKLGDLSRAVKFNKFVSNYVKRLKYVVDCGWAVKIVFDGRRLPVKKATDDKRKTKREAAMTEFLKLKKAGHGKSEAASMARASSFKATNSLIHRLIWSLREEVYDDIIVAPHEGDAQCAFYNIIGLAHLVITRDSDLIVHQCHAIFFWNQIYCKGETNVRFGGIFYWRPDLCTIVSTRGRINWKMLIDNNWDNFISACVLAGSDYNVGVENVGVKTAVDLSIKHGSLSGVVDALLDPDNIEYSRYKVPQGFLAAARRAVLMFKHALVFEQHTNSVCHCRKLPDGSPPLISVGHPNWMGRIPISQTEAIQIARSDINPDTLTPYPEHIPREDATTDSPVESRRRRHSRAWEYPAYQWKELLAQHGILFKVPQTTSIPQDVLNKVLALTEDDVKNCAGLFSEYERNERETLEHFQRLREDTSTAWDIKMLQRWCKTRRLGYTKMRGKRTVHLQVPELLSRIETQVISKYMY